MNETPRPLRAGHRTRLVSALGTLAAVALLAAGSAACAVPSLGKSSAGNHACADKVAESSVVGSVPGLWNCLSPRLQADLSARGASGDGALVSQPFASSSVFVGATGDEATYEQTFLPAIAQQSGFHEQIVTIWLDSAGKVDGLDVGPSPS